MQSKASDLIYEVWKWGQEELAPCMERKKIKCRFIDSFFSICWWCIECASPLKSSRIQIVNKRGKENMWRVFVLRGVTCRYQSFQVGNRGSRKAVWAPAGGAGTKHINTTLRMEGGSYRAEAGKETKWSCFTFESCFSAELHYKFTEVTTVAIKQMFLFLNLQRKGNVHCFAFCKV